MNIRQTVVKNTLLQILLQFFNLLAGFYSYSLIARYLGKTTFGKYGFISSFYFFFIAFLDFGISVLIVREIAKERSKAGLFLSNLITFKLFLGILLSFIAVAVANIYAFPPDLKLALSLYAPVLILISLESIQIIFEADLRYEYIALASFFWRLSSLLFIVLAVKLNLGIAYIVISFLLGEVIKCLIFYFSSKKFVTIKVPLIDINMWIGLIKKAFPIFATSLLVTAIRNTDVMMLTRMKGFAEVGLYLAPYRLCDMSLSIPIALMTSAFPLMSRFYKQDFDVFTRIYQKAFDILSVSGILLTVLVLVLADQIIILLFGNDFIGSVPGFRILIFSALLVYLGISSATLLIVTDNQRVSMWFYILGAPLNILLNLILIPRLGFVGAAISNITAMFFIVSATFYFVKVKIKVPIKITSTWKALLVGIVTFVALSYLKRFGLFISLPAGILLYAFLVIYFRIIDINDILLLTRKGDKINAQPAAGL